jgi:hypothetical protein
VMARRADRATGAAMSAYGPNADHLGASATGPNMVVFEQDKSASPGSAQAEWDTRQLLNRAHFYTGKGEFHA